MKISKRDALAWFRFFDEYMSEDAPGIRQQEIVYSVLAQIEDAVEAHFDRLRESIPGLQSLNGRTDYVGNPDKFPKGCVSCLCGTGLSAIRKTNRCNLACPFCYDFGQLDQVPPVGEGMWEIGGARYRERDLDMLLSVGRKPSGVAYVYLEPFMEIEVYYDVIRRFARAGVHQHMYTNGTLATEENLAALGEAGLSELRFNLGASGCADSVIEAMKTARKYIPQVGIETPMTPDFLDRFEKKKDQILDTGIDFMNCAELHLGVNNAGNYAGEKVYMYRQGYLSPVFSREITFRLMGEAVREKWDIVVHDCSNRTKFVRDVNQKAKEGGWFGASSYGSEFDLVPYGLFLPILEDTDFAFLEEDELPPGYRFGELIL